MWCVLGSPVSTLMIALVHGHVHDVALGLSAQSSRRLATGSPGSTWPSSRVFRSLGMQCAALGIGTYDPRLAVVAWHRQSFHTSSHLLSAPRQSSVPSFRGQGTQLEIARKRLLLVRRVTRRTMYSSPLLCPHAWRVASPSFPPSIPRGSWLWTCFKGSV